jgi:dimethylargininase
VPRILRLYALQPVSLGFLLSSLSLLFSNLRVIAVTREVSPSINHCELSFHTREAIDIPKAIAQHKAYQACLTQLGVRIVSLPTEPDLPDAVFVEDTAVVLDEIAVVTNMGAPSRRAESRSIAETLSRYRPLKFITNPATLDGGDVLRTGRKIFVGTSQRTNREGYVQFRDILSAYNYEVQPIDVRGCLHLKSACSHIGNNTVLVNRSRIDAESLHTT